MAEFGDFASQGEANDDTITVDMCDYGYVDECNDQKKLNGILSLLKSGKEGFYPDVSAINVLQLPRVYRVFVHITLLVMT